MVVLQISHSFCWHYIEEVNVCGCLWDLWECVPGAYPQATEALRIQQETEQCLFAFFEIAARLAKCKGFFG